MIVEIGHHPAQEPGPPQKRALGDTAAPKHHVVAAAGAGVQPVELELLRTQSAGPGLLRERLAEPDQLPPRAGRRHVDLDHAGVGRDVQPDEAGIVRRRVAFEHHGRVPLAGDLLDGRHQLEPVSRGARSLRVAGLDGERIERRKEDVQPAVPRLDHRRSAHDPGVGRQLLLGRPGQARHRQPQAGRRVAGQERHAATRHRPIARPPA